MAFRRGFRLVVELFEVCEWCARVVPVGTELTVPYLLVNRGAIEGDEDRGCEIQSSDSVSTQPRAAIGAAATVSGKAVFERK